MRLAQIIRFALISLAFFIQGCSLFNPAPVEPVPDLPKPAPKLPPLQLDAHSAGVAYIADGNGSLYLCNVDITNKLTNCKTTGKTEDGLKLSWLPNYVTFNTKNGITSAYVVSAESIYICGIAADKNLINCRNTGSVDKYNDMVKWLPTNLSFNNESAINTYAYVAGVTTVYRCNISDNGSLTSCAATGKSLGKKVAMHWLPNGIAFNRMGQNTYAYVAASSKLFQCSVNSEGELIDCHKTGQTATKRNITWHPNDLTFTPQGGGFYSYVADPYYVYVCNVTDEGGLSSCTQTGSAKGGAALNWLPNSIAFNLNLSAKYAYVVGVYNIYVCDAATNGLLSNCEVAATDSNGKALNWSPKNIWLR